MYKPLPMSKMNKGVIWLPADMSSSDPIRIDSPAMKVMTDLRRTFAVTVPAGTYHVAVHVDQIKRGYTMTLDQGSSVNLYIT